MEIEVSDWNTRRDVLRAIRQRVFIDEQNVPESLEWDADDDGAIHFLALDGKRPVGCARLLKDGHFGRMAVIPEYRRQKIGTLLLRALEGYYQRELHGRILRANVQTQAWGFYLQNGFIPEPRFNMDAGMAHIQMGRAVGRADHDNDILIPGHDNNLYHFEPAAATEGLLQIGCQSSPLSISLAITDLSHPAWSDRNTLSCINRYLREARQRSVSILLMDEYRGIADHPLIQLQHRMSSRIEVKVNASLKETQILLRPWSWVVVGREEVRTCLNDRARTAKLNEQFQELWRTAQPCREGRRLKI